MTEEKAITTLADVPLTESTIAEHWRVPTQAVTVTTEAAHGGWVARAAVDLGHRVERFSEAGTTEARALERLAEASEHRAAWHHHF